jgi:hypothetical protein
MVVHRTALWVLYGVCCVAAVAIALHSAFVTTDRRRSLRFVETLLDRLLVGLGVGLAAAVVLLFMAAALTHA